MAIAASDLPVGSAPQPPPLPHFPTRQQAFVWRNWELVPVARLARVLAARPRDVLALAQGMGLRVPPRTQKGWLTHGYCTLIRKNWHLLPYDQLLTLWTGQPSSSTTRCARTTSSG